MLWSVAILFHAVRLLKSFQNLFQCGAPNIALEPTANSLRSYVAPVIGGGSPRAFGLSGRFEEKINRWLLDFLSGSRRSH
jgi:hypothetical protein